MLKQHRKESNKIGLRWMMRSKIKLMIEKLLKRVWIFKKSKEWRKRENFKKKEKELKKRKEELKMLSERRLLNKPKISNIGPLYLTKKTKN